VFGGFPAKEQYSDLVITYSRWDLQQKNVHKYQIFTNISRTIFNNLIIQPAGFDENIWMSNLSGPIVDYIRKPPHRLGIWLVAER